jgi:hypothetical protein
MQHFQIAVPLGNLPVQLICISNGTVAFVRTQDFGAIFDHPENGVSAKFTNESFSLGQEDFIYNTAYRYKEIDVMLSWLTQQQLEMPVFGN